MNDTPRHLALAFALRPINPNPLQLTVSPAVIEQRMRHLSDIYPYLDDAEKVRADEWCFEAEIILAASRKALHQVEQKAIHHGG